MEKIVLNTFLIIALLIVPAGRGVAKVSRAIIIDRETATGGLPGGNTPYESGLILIIVISVAFGIKHVSDPEKKN